MTAVGFGLMVMVVDKGHFTFVDFSCFLLQSGVLMGVKCSTLKLNTLEMKLKSWV